MKKMTNTSRTFTFILAMMMILGRTSFALAEEAAEPTKHYGQIVGTIEEVRPYYDDQQIPHHDRPFIVIKDAEGATYTFTVDAYTYIPENTSFKEGDQVIGIYDLTAPALMIYPPQYSALVLAPYAPDTSIKVERFSADSISADGELQILPGDYPIHFYNGIAFTGDMADPLLAVFYTTSTRSIPAKTTPERIVILREKTIEIEMEAETETDVKID